MKPDEHDRLTFLDLSIGTLEAHLRAAEQQLAKLEEDRRRLKAQAFIQQHGIRRRDVTRSEGYNKPRFGHIGVFSEWLKTHNHKPWVEWNGLVLRAEDVKSGKFVFDNAVRMEDLP